MNFQGSGKTLAFGIPIVARLLESAPESKCLRALVLAPTRELAVQVRNHITSIIKYTDLKVLFSALVALFEFNFYHLCKLCNFCS